MNYINSLKICYNELYIFWIFLDIKLKEGNILKLDFIKFSPTENMTVLIESKLSREKYIKVSNQIMNYNNVNAEQVGFIEENVEKNLVRLQMMGGEFCGNATRSLAAYLQYKKHNCIQYIDDKIIVPLEVSGADDMQYCEVEETQHENIFNVSVKMPLHQSIEEFEIDFKGKLLKGCLVFFQGITHLIISSRNIDSKELFYLEVKKKLSDLEYDALGIMFFEEEKIYIEPLVYVRATESIVWEKGCGSGSAALGVYLTMQNKRSMDIVINQPGGELEIKTLWENNRIEEITLSGLVTIVANGELFFNE